MDLKRSKKSLSEKIGQELRTQAGARTHGSWTLYPSSSRPSRSKTGAPPGTTTLPKVDTGHKVAYQPVLWLESAFVRLCSSYFLSVLPQQLPVESDHGDHLLSERRVVMEHRPWGFQRPGGMVGHEWSAQWTFN